MKLVMFFQINNSIYFLVAIPIDKYASCRYVLYSSGHIVHDFSTSDSPKEMGGKIAIDKENNLYYLDDDHDMVKDPNYIIKYKQNKQVFKKVINIEYHKKHR